MSECVKAIIAGRDGTTCPGDVYVLNAPYNGGTHIPDITVVTPVFSEDDHRDLTHSSPRTPLFWVASRGHHSEIGGITPGSMPPFSRSIEDEGILIDNFQLVDRGEFREKEVRALLVDHKYPSRNVEQNLSDLRAQIAANSAGLVEIHKAVNTYGLGVVQEYMKHVQDNAEEAVRRVITTLKDGEFTYDMDSDEDGTPFVKIKVSVDHQEVGADTCARSCLNHFPSTPHVPSPHLLLRRR
jgi:N-methylhydantoinase B/oxoprolinase/acetone carboxylase alpha subunit